MRALLLLFVFAHAVFAGATHFHRVSRQEGPGHASVREDAAGESPAARGHIQCVLCRLQRQFDSAGRPAEPRVIVPTSEAPAPEAYLANTKSCAHPLLKRGRAPPLA